MDYTKIVGKFGGTSVANAAMVRKVQAITAQRPQMQYVIVSAPEGVTNLLFSCFEQRAGEFGQFFERIEKCFKDMVAELALVFDPEPHFRQMREHIARGEKDALVSRGEYLCGLIVAGFLGFEFLDATQFIVLRDSGEYDLEATRRAWKALGLSDNKRYVIPGFYGSLPDGSIRLFPRNSSDLTGSIVAVCAGAALFQKWTNVSGIRRAAPDVVPNAERIDEITYKELRELTDQGSKVLYSPALFPLLEEGIPLEVKNTDKPEEDGTLVVPDRMAKAKPMGTVVGISARKDFTIITVEKAMMPRGYAARVLGIFDRMGIDIAHITDGVDVLSLAVATRDIQNGKHGELRSELRRACKPDMINATDGLSIIAVVGHWMNGATGTASKIFSALAARGINLDIIDQSASQISIVIGVKNTDCERAVNAIYDSVIRKK